MNTQTLQAPCESALPTPGPIGWAERGYVPDAIARAAIRNLCSTRLRAERAGGPEAMASRFEARIALLRSSALAIHPEMANRQHYEVAPAFFEHCLGPRLKYSCAYYAQGHESLAEAEAAMLALTAERAMLTDAHDILELGCGWGSLTLWMAERFPHARITAVSNSNAQRRFIEARCRERDFRNVHVCTRDVNELELDAESFDRVVSVEMFEHVRNYELLLKRIARWLRPTGRLFVHVFCHRTLLYPFETDGEGEWMARHFFTGGLMPSADTFLRFQDDVALEAQWLVDGRHYERTANHWLARQDQSRGAILEIFEETYGVCAALWFQRWRLFWMACAEQFGFAAGSEWMVGHYRFIRRDSR